MKDDTTLFFTLRSQKELFLTVDSAFEEVALLFLRFFVGDNVLGCWPPFTAGYSNSLNVWPSKVRLNMAELFMSYGPMEE